MTIEVDLQQAESHHRAQRFGEAETLYRAVLAAAPAHPEANLKLGLLMIQTRAAEALPLFRSAIEAEPARAELWSVYMDALKLAGQPDEAGRVAALARDAGLEPGPSGAPLPDGQNEIATLAREFAATLETLEARGMHDQVEALARQMTEWLPQHGLGWRALAHAFLRRGDLPGALPYLDRAAALLPGDAELARQREAAAALRDARALEAGGALEEAGARYRAVLAVYPELPEANHALGVIEIRLCRPEASLPYLERALGADPNQLQYWAHYVDGLLQAGQLKAAWLALEMGQQRGLAGPAVDKLINLMTMVSSMPTSKVPFVKLAAPAAGEAERAEKADDAKPADETAGGSRNATEATASAPATPPPAKDIEALAAHYNQGRVEQALAAAGKLIDRFPAHGFAWKVKTLALHRLGRYAEALDCSTTARRLLPEDIDLLQVTAGMLESHGRHSEAEAECARLLALKPAHAEGHRIMGIVTASLGRFEDAERHGWQSVRLDPNCPMAPNTLGVTLMKLGRLDEAIALFRRSLELNPQHDLAYDNLVFCLTHSEDVTPAELFAEHRGYAERFEAPLKAAWPRHRQSRDPERRLRVGFISGDFCRHAVASFFEPVARELARDESLALYAFSNTPRSDAVTEKLKPLFAQWHHVAGRTHADVARLVESEQIDILIDLAGHTAHNGLLAMAHKPAPLQASWIGYPGTTGLDAIDYYLADRFWVPPSLQAQFTEQIVYLPAFAPFMPDAIAPPVNLLPALHSGHVTFGSFNRMDKLRRDVIALWCELLRAVPGSRMLIGATPMDGKLGELPAWFAEEGIAPERLEFRPRASVPVYLQQHHRVDLCLDTFPFSGLTTALHSLWMGVPTLTLPGDTVPGRSGLTAMSHVGLTDFIATGKDDFVRRGVALARDLDALAALRAGMRERCAASPVFRPETAAASVSHALRTMWRRWCEGRPAASFEIDAAEAQAAWHTHRAFAA